MILTQAQKLEVLRGISTTIISEAQSERFSAVCGENEEARKAVESFMASVAEWIISAHPSQRWTYH